MKRLAAAALVILAFAMTGCAPAAPSKDKLAERFLLELTDSATTRTAMSSLAFKAADDMLSGQCGSTSYETGLRSNGDDDLLYAWRVTCLTYFESDLSPAQVAETKRMIVTHTAS